MEDVAEHCTAAASRVHPDPVLRFPPGDQPAEPVPTGSPGSDAGVVVCRDVW